MDIYTTAKSITHESNYILMRLANVYCLLQRSFFKQFYGSVTKSEYIALRQAFIMVLLLLSYSNILFRLLNLLCNNTYTFLTLLESLPHKPII